MLPEPSALPRGTARARAARWRGALGARADRCGARRGCAGHARVRHTFVANCAARWTARHWVERADTGDIIRRELADPEIRWIESACHCVGRRIAARSSGIRQLARVQEPEKVENLVRQQTLAIRWILEAVRSRKGRPTAEKLAQELMDCYNKTGTTIQKRENTHRMAEANKAFSHFA